MPFTTGLASSGNKKPFLNVKEGAKVFGIEDVKNFKESHNLNYFYTVHVGLSCDQGSRKYMEDRYEAKAIEPFPDILPDFKVAYIAVYDGHAGSSTVELVLQNLCNIIMKKWKKELCKAIINDEEDDEIIKNFDVGTIERDQIEKSCVAMLVAVIEKSFEKMQKILQDRYEITKKSDGSTVVSTLLVHNKLFSVHCGDSRAILIRSGNCVQLTEDHKPNSPLERERIESLGSTVKRHGPVYRVDHNLSVARSLGDCMFKVSLFRCKMILC